MISSLQSSTMEEMIVLVRLGFARTSRMALVSIPISTTWLFLRIQRERPSRTAHNSDMKLEVMPMILENPSNQAPVSSRRIPPPPAIPRLPKDDPSVLSLIHPLGGFSHLIDLRMYQTEGFPLITQ